MYDSFYHHRTKNNLDLLKSTLVSRPLRLFESKHNIIRNETPFNSYPFGEIYQSKEKKNFPVVRDDLNSQILSKRSNKLNLINKNECASMKNNTNTIETETQLKPRIHIQRMPPIRIYTSLKTPESLFINKETSIARIPDLTISKRTSSSIKPSFVGMNSKAEPTRSLAAVSFEIPSISLIKKLNLPKIKAKSWVVFDEMTNKLLCSKKPRKTREIASLTKIMTCYISCYYIEKFGIEAANYYVKVPKMATFLTGTTAKLESGDYISIKDLLYGMMLPSGNDAAYCLGSFFGKLGYILYQEEKTRSIGGKNLKFSDIYREKWNGDYSKKDFVKYFVCEMNKTARSQGLFNTCFSNPHGLADNTNKSTAEDIGKLSIIALKSKLFSEIVNKREYFCKITTKRKEIKEMLWRNTNKLLDKGFNGVKTGNTPTAGPCFSACYRDNERRFVVVVLKTKSEKSRFGDTLKLVKWLINNTTKEDMKEEYF